MEADIAACQKALGESTICFADLVGWSSWLGGQISLHHAD